MAKGDQKRTRQAVQTQQTKQNQQQDEIYNTMRPAYETGLTTDQGTRGEIEDRYRSFTPQYNPDAYLGTGTGGGGGGGGITRNIPNINLTNISGGIDPNMINRMGADSYEGYRQMSSGLRPEFWSDFNKYMGNFDTANQSLGGAADSYRNFINTGGFSEADLGNIRARSIAPTRSIYQNAQDDISTQMSRAGLNPLAGLAYSRKLNRQANDQIGDISRATEADIAERVQSGKLAGTAGLAGVGVSQAQVADMQVNARNQVEQLDHQMRSQGLAGMTDIEKKRLESHLTNQQITQAGQIATNQGRLSKAQIESQAQSTNASLAQQARQFDAQMRFEADQARNRDMLNNQAGWSNLYGTSPGYTGTVGGQLLQMQNQGANQNMGLIDRQINASQMPGDYDIALGRFGNTVNLAGSVMSLGQKSYSGTNPGGSAPMIQSQPYGGNYGTAGPGYGYTQNYKI